MNSLIFLVDLQLKLIEILETLSTHCLSFPVLFFPMPSLQCAINCSQIIAVAICKTSYKYAHVPLRFIFMHFPNFMVLISI